ncbi:GPR158 [Mytilus coruscus]|uniref:GPR158 n=1 Tax=Mytilus coruscus TaxID=42192 RepID=A0A6J8AWE2_MYTCO|nr:GPR158 [Mytilus coruscus]
MHGYISPEHKITLEDRDAEKEAVQLALEYVSRIEQSPCTGGTEETLDLIFNHTAWEAFVSPAILTSNFLTSNLLANNGSLDSLTDEMFFSLVKSNVIGQTAVFGSGIAIEPGIYSKYSSFVPYAFHKNGTVFAHDVALSYTYQDNNKTVWSGNTSLLEKETVLLTAKIEDGHWTKPYFDCGGGDIWMVTFTSPLFSLDSTGNPKFQGIASVDIELTYIDINQCDPDTSSYSALDVFRGTHACPVTTEGFFAYPKASRFLCISQIWVYHIGFNLMYGALVIKTWRIAIIFRPASKLQRVHLPDKELLKRFLPPMCVVTVYVIAWTVSEKGTTKTLETANLLKYDVCFNRYWLYAIQCAEVCLLLAGCYMCYLVRKAPGHFNESRYITWAVYNGIILGSFLLILTHLIGHSYGPDLLYLLQGLQIQAFVTITLTLIFIPKISALYRKEDIKKTNDTFKITNENKYLRTNDFEATPTKSVVTQTYENITPHPKVLMLRLQPNVDRHTRGDVDKDATKLALEYVSRIEQSPCTGGTEETLDLIFNNTAWETFVSPAILTSNFLTSNLLANNGSLDSLTDEIFFSLVKSNVIGQTTVFGSGIAIEPGIYSKYSSFSPYAYRKNGIVFAHDIALSYTYQDKTTVWYYPLQSMNWENATKTVSKTKFRSGNTSLPEKETVLLTAKLEDGHWTKPYFDCGGGDIWMVTFSSPLFSLDLTGNPKFQGVASVDIELTNIDINQCDPDTSSYSALDVFRGTHRCPATTECWFLKGQGFKRGTYQCVCIKGYYFPNVNAQVKAFSGLEVENSSDTSLGFFAYPGASRFLCISQIWVYHIGFNLMYGALVIKTWRIAIIFRPASKLQRVHLPDKELLKRFLPPMCVVTVYLLAWTISVKGTTETLETSNLLKYDVCFKGYWLYAIQCAEVCLLLAGCYMCYLVRKTPGHFNESRYITWAVYNGIILGSFLLILTHLIGHSYGPDLLYLLQGLKIQAFVTITLTFIYVPKLSALYKKEDIKKTNDTFKITNENKYLRTNDFETTQTKSVGTQTYENVTPNQKVFMLRLSFLITGDSDKEAVQLALEYVSRVEQSPCTGGNEETLDLIFNHTEWEAYVKPAIFTSKFITSILLENNGSLNSLTDEIFFSLVKSIINGQKTIFGLGIALEPGVYSKYSSFAPYAYHKYDTVYVHDIALSYNYQNNNNILWYYNLKKRNWENATRTLSKTKFRSGNISLAEQDTVLLTTNIEDGFWTKPYFDCGGGDIWMVTFTTPIFSLDLSGKPKFQGAAGVDIELTNIDINQCDPDTSNYNVLDVFRGTHKCFPTTECRFLKGQGFKRGAYQCVCSKGYYFPDMNAQVKAFSGLKVENASYANQYKCSPCIEGCTECVDDSPCLYQFMLLFRFPVLLVTLLTCIGIGVLSTATVCFRNELAIKTGSPIFLLLMCGGGVLICSTTFDWSFLWTRLAVPIARAADSSVRYNNFDLNPYSKEDLRLRLRLRTDIASNMDLTSHSRQIQDRLFKLNSLMSTATAHSLHSSSIKTVPFSALCKKEDIKKANNTFKTEYDSKYLKTNTIEATPLKSVGTQTYECSLDQKVLVLKKVIVFTQNYENQSQKF